MSLGRHAGFMEGDKEGAPAPGDPRHHDGRLQVISEVRPPHIPGGWASRASAGGGVLRTEEGRQGRSGAAGWPWGAFHWHLRDVSERLLLASGLPRTILESNCLLIPSGCN